MEAASHFKRVKVVLQTQYDEKKCPSSNGRGKEV
jgi:hypothetical protein